MPGTFFVELATEAIGVGSFKLVIGVFVAGIEFLVLELLESAGEGAWDVEETWRGREADCSGDGWFWRWSTWIGVVFRIAGAGVREKEDVTGDF